MLIEMVVIAGQSVTSLSIDAYQMVLYHSLRVLLHSKVTDTYYYIGDFKDKDSWPHIVDNVNNPLKIPDLANTSTLIYQEPLPIFSKSLMHIKFSTIVVA